MKPITPVFTSMDVVILCGGKGTRLQPVLSDRPKALAPFGKVTFLDILIASLKEYGFEKFILCTGYMKEQIRHHFENTGNPPVLFSEEDVPLGTGGALRNARPLIQSSTFLVLNGDSLCSIDYNAFYRFHREKKALLSMALVHIADRKDFGSVLLSESGEIAGFTEKGTTGGGGYINAGMYFMEKEIFPHLPDTRSFSLEQDVFPSLSHHRSFGFPLDGELMDIGTPERFRKAQGILKDNL
jgi:NDP-sugar pyrophosphorylase family protein